VDGKGKTGRVVLEHVEAVCDEGKGADGVTCGFVGEKGRGQRTRKRQTSNNLDDKEDRIDGEQDGDAG
jgi:hypothetical protein